MFKVYTTPVCPYCLRAKQLLTQLGAEYEEIDVAANPALRQEMIEKTGWQTVPIIMHGDELIGGYDDLARLHAQGRLVEMINS